MRRLRHGRKRGLKHGVSSATGAVAGAGKAAGGKAVGAARKAGDAVPTPSFLQSTKAKIAAGIGAAGAAAAGAFALVRRRGKQGSEAATETLGADPDPLAEPAGNGAAPDKVETDV